MSRLVGRQRSRTPWRAAVLVGALVLLATACVAPGTWPKQVSGPRRAVPATTATPAPTTPPAPTWETLFTDHFDGAAGVGPDQWHTMPGWSPAAHNGLGQLDVGHLSQLRTNVGWTLPAGTQVRVTASLLMPDTGSNYAAFWVQHPDGHDPREIDVIESYGPLKPAGAQLGSHICYDDTPETAVNACAATGRAPELWPVSHAFPAGLEPWRAYWVYEAEFTIGGDTVRFTAGDDRGNRTYEVASTPDLRRVPSNAVPFHLRLSNKDVEPQYAVPGGSRHSMLVDWVTVEVKHPTAPG